MNAHSGHLSAQIPDTFAIPTDRPRLNKPVPTDRISPPNQLNILRAWALESKEGKEAATVNEVARRVGMVSSTVAMTNPFFSTLGLLERLARGTYLPSNEVVAFFNAPNPETAARQLASKFRDAWFGQLLIPRLKYASMDEQSALSLLEETCGVGQEQRKALGFILDFMVEVGLIERSRDQIKLTSWAQAPPHLVPTISRDGSSYSVTVRVDSKAVAESLLELFTTLANWAVKK